MRRIATNAVVVGGHSRNIGKTGVMAGLIRGLEPLGWTAMKITQYGHGICSLNGEPCGCAPAEHSFVLTEERDPRGRSDTCRFLAAGARRSLWLRARQGRLAEAFADLDRVLRQSGWVMIESNSVMELIDPGVYVVVLDNSQRDFKSSSRQFIERADALVSVGAKLNTRVWPGLDPAIIESKPRFAVSAGGYDSPELCRFIRQTLELPRAETLAEVASRAAGQKENSWRH
jgi:hypothetical protein